MAAPSDKHGNESNEDNLTENDDIHPELNVLSLDFDPLKALYSSSVVLPFPNAPCFNNLSEYESCTSGARGRGQGRSTTSSASARNRQRKKELKARASELQDTPRSAPRNVLTRMTEQTEGPYSLLYACVQKRCKIQVCVRSFKGLRGICTGYLVAFDREMNMALSDVDEVYRIPSTGQRFYHEETLTYSKIMEYSKIRPNRCEQLAETSQSKGEKNRDQSSGRAHHVAMSKELRERGSHSSQSHQRKNTTTHQDSRNKDTEERKRSGKGKKKDDKGLEVENAEEEALYLKLTKLKVELAKLSAEDPEFTAKPSGSQEPKTGSTDASEKEPKPCEKQRTEACDDTACDKSPTSHGEDMCKPMAFEKQLMKSGKLKTTPGVTATSHVRTKHQGLKPGDKSLRSGDCDKLNAAGRLRIKPEDFQRRHVNQLFLRGDNVVLVSVDKVLLGKT